MGDNLIAEILAAHGGRLAAGEENLVETYLAIFPAQAAELRPLLELAEEVARLFRPVHQPDPRFRAELKRDLLAQYHQQRANTWTWNSGRTLAAVGVGGAVAVAGLIAYWRGRQAAPPAI
jgi:anti-sigma factor RsiW